MRIKFSFKRAGSAAVVAAVVLGTMSALAAPAHADDIPQQAASTIPPVAQRNPTTGVTADALPTVQINGVVWSETVVGNTVYAGGSFANARPAGSAAGVNTVTRNNLLSFDITTGVLNTAFNPNLNSTVNTVTKSPNGAVIYVGGSFTSANGVTRNRIAAYNASTGALLTTFAPSLDATVYSITATNTTVYVGGVFGNANGQTRSHLAAFSASSGALLPWAPVADDYVKAIQLTPDFSHVIVGGPFENINGSSAYGLGSIDATTGALVPYAANQVVQDAGSGASIVSLSTDGTYIYSTSYVYTNTGNFEGVSSTNPSTGAINWLADCHGDTYGSYGVNGVVYVVSHEHFCTPVGGFPDSNPRNIYHRSTAFTQNATGLNQTDTETGNGYGNFAGQPSPSLINWFPDLDTGTYTGQTQGPWSVSGNSQYVVEGGEFLHVNNTAQQGLVRFAVPSIAPNAQGPQVSAAAANPTLVARSATSVRVAWQTNWDRDDENLTYNVYRNDVLVYTTQATSQSWNRPTIGWVDTNDKPGTTYNYRIRASDPGGKVAYSNEVPVTTPASSATDGAYVKDVLAAGASDFWLLDQAAGATTNYDYAGFNDLTLNSGVAGGAAGAVNDNDTASTFDGSSSGFASTTAPTPGPNVFTESAWFSTTSTSGGKILGFGDQSTGTSSNYDRHIYMDASGHINFGVYNNNSYVITSPGTYNDGQYHQVVASLSTAGMALYIDGRLVGTNTGTTVGQTYNGYWRIGGDSSWSGNNFFAGTIDDVAIFPTALTLAQIRQQYTDSGRVLVGVTPPADHYGATVWNDSPSAYYRLDEATGTTAVDASGNTNNGIYSGGYALGAASPVSGSTGTAVTFNGVDGTLASTQQISGPSVYSEEAWFNTTSTAGGKIIGFGDQQTGNSGSYDRHVYMLPNGQLVFGTYTGALNLATSVNSYNDGKWHYVAATQGPDGMTLYVDGQPVATNPQTSAQAYSGYWRVGGDNLNGWNAGNAYFGGTIDEAAFYNGELTAAQVLAHYNASPAATAANVAPTASFTATATNLSVSVNGSASADSDGTVVGYAWNYGDGGTDTGATPAAHVYAAAGTYTITLTVTDNGGLTGTTTKSVTVAAANVAPTASFTATATNLTVALNAGASSDSDGTIASYAWNYGDGTTGTGVTSSHTYTAAGSYNITLTVTDNGGLTGTTTTNVTVVLSVLASDSFSRTVASGLGTADVGGAWTIVSGAAAQASVNGSVARMNLPSAGYQLAALLNSYSQQDQNIVADTTANAAATGNGIYQSILARHVGSSDYRLKIRLLPGNVVHLAMSKVVNGTETYFSEVNVTGLNYQVGNTLRMRFVLKTTNGVTSLTGTVWNPASTEPKAQISTTDSTASLQVPGALGLVSYIPTGVTTVPVLTTWDNLTVVAP